MLVLLTSSWWRRLDDVGTIDIDLPVPAAASRLAPRSPLEWWSSAPRVLQFERRTLSRGTR